NFYTIIADETFISITGKLKVVETEDSQFQNRTDLPSKIEPTYPPKSNSNLQDHINLQDNITSLKNKQKETKVSTSKFIIEDELQKEEYNSLDVKIKEKLILFFAKTKGGKDKDSFDIYLETLKQMSVKNQLISINNSITAKYKTIYLIEEKTKASYPTQKPQFATSKEIKSELNEYAGY
ncbi:MAG: hypothetical protein ACRCXZ_06895, partial [Patescibacteria group bacterium]